MEEQNVKAKEVKMNVSRTGVGAEKQTQKLNYEELNQTCADMSQQLQNQNNYIKQLHQQMQQMQFILESRRLDYLFEVVRLKENFTSDFVITCCEEIEKTLTIAKQETEESSENN